MHLPRSSFVVAGLAVMVHVVAAPVAPGVRVSAVAVYTGSADASGAVACGREFFVVCDDEDSKLRVYRREVGGPPVSEVDLSAWKALSVAGAKKELDLEAAARLGDRIFWIGSHGNSREGKITPNRRQLFATTLTSDKGGYEFALAGQPCRRLLDDLVAAPALREFHLAEAARKGRAPKDEGGFNVEGLAATPEGHLLLGFRNPIPRGRALLVPLLNPEKIISGAPVEIGQPILLDLGGRGVRDIVWSPEAREFLLLAGDFRAAEERRVVTQLYRWSGAEAVPQWVADFPELNPEALIVYPGSAGREVQVLSDDGTKPSRPPEQRTFRSVWVRW